MLLFVTVSVVVALTDAAIVDVVTVAVVPGTVNVILFIIMMMLLQ